MYLREISLDDLPFIDAWAKDEVFCKMAGWKKAYHQLEVAKWWIQCIEMNQEQSFKRLGIISEQKTIGYIDFAFIENGSSELGIVIGGSENWGKGYAKKAIQLALLYAQKELQLVELTAETHHTNSRAQRLLVHAGFVEVSQVGEEVYNGDIASLIQYELTFVQHVKERKA